jgi:4-amino-4-deoxy-L-arabinose transferase-like glycosyltransferase
MSNRSSLRAFFSRELALPFLLALFLLLLVSAFHGRYNYFRDELYYIACSDHLAFGFVDQPPLCAVILWISRHLLGDSLFAIRFFSGLAISTVVFLAALMARKIGGGKFAQALAALAILTAPGLVGQASLYTMNPFDILFWAIAAYVLLLILIDERPTLWLVFGVVLGFGLLNKYSIGFMVVGLGAGLLLTKQRKHLASKWFWLGAVAASILFLPHVIWEIEKGFPSLEFMSNASRMKNVNLGPAAFFTGQLRDMNIFSALLWMSGIWLFFRHERLRPLAWMYPVVFVVMIAGNAKVYYMMALYPLYLAAGSVWVERGFQRLQLRWTQYAYVTSMIVYGCISLPFALPVLSVTQFIDYQRLLGMRPEAHERLAVAELPQHYADQFGWEEMVALIADAFKRLTPLEQAECVIYVRNYGEAGAVDFYGGRYGLPKALCGHNNYWYWGPGSKSGNTAIIIGSSNNVQRSIDDLRRVYSSVEYIGSTNAAYAMPFENGRPLFICKGMNTSFQKIWPREKFFI